MKKLYQLEEENLEMPNLWSKSVYVYARGIVYSQYKVQLATRDNIHLRLTEADFHEICDLSKAQAFDIKMLHINNTPQPLVNEEMHILIADRQLLILCRKSIWK